MRKQHIGPLNSVKIGEDQIEWVKHTRLMGIKNLHMKKRIVNKLIFLKKGSFLSRNALLDLYFKIILPSVLYEGLNGVVAFTVIG